jgi:hypothetical protein
MEKFIAPPPEIAGIGKGADDTRSEALGSSLLGRQQCGASAFSGFGAPNAQHSTLQEVR